MLYGRSRSKAQKIEQKTLEPSSSIHVKFTLHDLSQRIVIL